MIGKFKVETTKNIIVEELFALRVKMYASKCGVDNKNKIKRISKSFSKNFKFEECKNVWMVKNIKKKVIIIF